MRCSCWDFRGHYYVQWMKSFHWLQLSLSALISNSMRHFTSEELAECISCMKQRKKRNDFLVGFCRIAGHLSVFIGGCMRMDQFVFRGVILALENIAELLLLKEQYYAEYRNVLRKDRKMLHREAIFLRSYIHAMHVR